MTGNALDEPRPQGAAVVAQQLGLVAWAMVKGKPELMAELEVIFEQAQKLVAEKARQKVLADAAPA